MITDKSVKCDLMKGSMPTDLQYISAKLLQ